MILGGSCVICLLFLIVSHLMSLTSAKAVSSEYSLTDSAERIGPWRVRLSKAWELLQASPCKDLQYRENCTKLKARRKREMNVYTAEKESELKRLVTVLVERVKGSFRNNDAVIVIDPFPDAHFGHTVIVFLIDFISRPSTCRGSFYISGNGQGECLHIAQTKDCRNQIGHGRKGRRKCEINFIPLVHTEADINITQRLACRSKYQGFAPCPELAGKSLNRANDKCTNSGRCSSQRRSKYTDSFLPWMSFCEKCDYGVLVSGGWNVLMNQKRHLDNLKDMRNYLKNKGFLEKNLKVFYANNRSIDQLENRDETAERTILPKPQNVTSFKDARKQRLQNEKTTFTAECGHT